MGVIRFLLVLYSIILLVRVLSTLFPIPPSGPIRRIFEVCYALTEPVLRPLRSLIPPVRMGMVGLDLSPIIVFVAISILLTVLPR